MADPLLPIEVQIRAKLQKDLVGLGLVELTNRMRANHLSFRGLGKKKMAQTLVRMYGEQASRDYGEDLIDLYKEIMADAAHHPNRLEERARRAWVVIAPDDTPEQVAVLVARAEACQYLVWETSLARWIKANVRIQVAGG